LGIAKTPIAMGIEEIMRIYGIPRDIPQKTEYPKPKQDTLLDDWDRKTTGIRLGCFTNQFSEKNQDRRKCRVQPKFSKK
jgi:hypothetical protein